MTAQFNPLQPIGENIHFFQPSPKPGVTRSPALITLCTWLGGATPQRIQKYISGYRALYPTSAILLITTHILEISALPFSVLHARLAPARDVIRRVVREGTDSILLHIFSHGGCNTAIQLALSLQADSNSPASAIQIGNHLSGIIFDCCPGDASFARAYQAAAHSLPRSEPVQTVGKVLLYPFIGITNGLQQTRLMSSVQDLRAQLNDPAVFGTTAARLYLYSMTDQVVGWEDVESHQKAARSALGCKVEGVAFPDSLHCALVKGHPERYWGEIRRFWTERRVMESPARSRL